MSKGLIAIFVSLLLGVFVGFFIGYEAPPYEVISSEQINKTDYALELKCHDGTGFALCLPLEKWVAMGLDSNEIILKANL